MTVAPAPPDPLPRRTLLVARLRQHRALALGQLVRGLAYGTGTALAGAVALWLRTHM
ncbi:MULTISPECIES: hypothetical protein [unclassified Streptomyces]|uniref:hypothetical protein n=1 Tax=unclassified Streptomyces TaxID=2593676 RepID=UPI00131C25D4|nr:MULTISPECIES: hypothetical protein [unclassified Streptomyces]MYX23505.1 hypothetical protein [Streptomyces sp. SID8380]